MMKFPKLSQTMLPAGFVFSLLASQSAFVLTASDGSVVGQGTFEESSDSVANIKVMFQGQEYSGTGIVRESARPSTLSMQRQGMRSDRAFSKSLGMRHKKQAKTFMVAEDGSKLACDLTISGSEFGGKCINPDNQQALTIKSTPG